MSESHGMRETHPQPCLWQVTLTHTCNNALADSCGMQGTPIASRWGGLSPFGRAALAEMNRLGMIVDVSHTSPQTASQAMSISKAPVIFSHSNARGVHDVVRNLPDSILQRIGRIGLAASLDGPDEDDKP